MSIHNQHKPGYNYTPFGWIPEEWEVLKLNEILKEGRLGGNYENAELNNGMPVIKMGNVGRGKINLDTVQSLPLDSEYNKEDILKEGDLLFNTRNTLDLVGKVSIWNNELPIAIYNSNLMRLKFKEEFVDNNVYMNWVFNSYYGLKQLRAFATGTTSVAAIYGRDLEHFKCLIPSKCEQRKISAILSTWDEAITKTQQLIAQLQQRNKGLMQQLLKPKDGWKEVKLADVFDRVIRKNSEANKTVVTISAQRGFVKQQDFFKKIVASDITDNYFLVHRGEFCYNKSYSKGYDWGATKRLNDFDKAVVTTLYICFRLKDEGQYSGNYFEYFFDANILDKGLSKIAHEGGRAHGLLNVTPTDFFSLKIVVPDNNQQLKIASILSTAKNELNIYEQKLAALQQQKKGLMQKLLTGEVRVKV